MPDLNPGDELFASYLQVRELSPEQVANPSSGGFLRRWQWFVLPALANERDPFKTPTAKVMMRQQTGPDNRSRWSMLDHKLDDLPESVRFVIADGQTYNKVRRLDTPLVIGMDPTEHREITANPDRAPWSLIKRVSRVSVTHGGFVIL